MAGVSDKLDLMTVSLYCCNTVNQNIEHFLKDKTMKLTLYLESIHEQFPAFWSLVNADRNMKSALMEFRSKSNSIIQ